MPNSRTQSNMGIATGDTRYLKLDQTTPQTITGGIPLLTNLTPSQNYEIATKKYVDDAIVAGGGYTDEQAQDAVGGILDDGTVGDVVFTYDDAGNKISGVVEDDSHAHTGATLSGIDISADTNLAVTAPIILTDDTLSHSAANGYVHTPANGASAQLLQYSSAGTSKWITLSGDASIADGGVLGVNKLRLNVRNETGSTIASTKAVYITGLNNLPLIALADNTLDLKHNVVGITIAPIGHEANGFIATQGQCDAETNAWNVGDELYVSTSGELTNVTPTVGDVQHIGIVTVKENYPVGKILIYKFPETHYLATPISTDAIIRMGDNSGANKVSFRDYANNEVGSVNSDGALKMAESLGVLDTGTTKYLSIVSNSTTDFTADRILTIDLDNVARTLKFAGDATISGVNSGDQDLSGYELLANKATDFSTINNTLYPTVEAVNNAIANAVVGLLDYRGTYDASTNLFPATGGSGLLGAVLKGDFWLCSVGGTLGTETVEAGDLIIALVDTPGQTASNWDLVQHAGNYQPIDATLTSIALLGTAADKMLYTTGIDTWAETGLTSAARSILDDTTVGAIRTTLGVGTGDSPTFAGLTSNGNVLLSTAGAIGSVTGSYNYIGTNVIYNAGAGTWDQIAGGSTANLFVQSSTLFRFYTGTDAANPTWTERLQIGSDGIHASRMYLNSTAYLDGATAGVITVTGSILYPNATSLNFKKADDSSYGVLQLFSNNEVYLDSPGDVNVRPGAGNTVLEIQTTGVNVSGALTVSGAASNITISGAGDPTISTTYGADASIELYDGATGLMTFTNGYGSGFKYVGGPLILDSKITTYNNIATEGYGVPAIVDYVALADQSASIGATNMTNAATAGLYRVSYYLETTVNQGGTPIASVLLTIGWTDDEGAKTQASSTIQLPTDTNTDGVFVIRNAGANITYATTASNVSTGRYNLYITCERLN